MGGAHFLAAGAATLWAALHLWKRSVSWCSPACRPLARHIASTSMCCGTLCPARLQVLSASPGLTWTSAPPPWLTYTYTHTHTCILARTCGFRMPAGAAQGRGLQQAVRGDVSGGGWSHHHQSGGRDASALQRMPPAQEAARVGLQDSGAAAPGGPQAQCVLGACVTSEGDASSGRLGGGCMVGLGQRRGCMTSRGRRRGRRQSRKVL